MPETQPVLRELRLACAVGEAVPAELVPAWTLGVPSHRFVITDPPCDTTSDPSKYPTQRTPWTFQLNCISDEFEEPRRYCWVRVE
jgi:hypothetical protein